MGKTEKGKYPTQSTKELESGKKFGIYKISFFEFKAQKSDCII